MSSQQIDESYFQSDAETSIDVAELCLSTPTPLKQATSTATSLVTNILVVGGAYAGLSAIISMKNHLREQSRVDPNYRQKLARLYSRDPSSQHHPGDINISITLVEPRAGLLNIIGIPRCMVDLEFAASQYIPLSQLQDITFDKIISDDETVISSMSTNSPPTSMPNADFGFQLNYIQGKVTYLDSERAQYVLNGDSKSKATIDFDYVVYAAGRDRTWPVTPHGYNLTAYLDEMKQFRDECQSHDIISIIGAGAVGIEVAGDIKKVFPDKKVNLIHPHALYPPEPLTDDFKSTVHDSLIRAGVNVILNCRIDRELPNGNLVTTSGDTIESNFNYWCNKHTNNVAALSNQLQKKFVSDTNNIYINQYLQLYNPITKDKISNFFCIGDLVQLPVIKSAGWALYMGRQVANNLVRIIFDGKLVEPLIEIAKTPRGMVLIAGNEEIVSELMGQVELNHQGYVQEYKDYCMGKVRATMIC